MKILVAYCGKFTIEIGPPRSMQALADLLAKRYEVEVTNNLKAKSPSAFGVSAKREIFAWLRNALRSYFFGQIYLIYHIFIFNFQIFRFCRNNKNPIIICSQPFVVPIFLTKDSRLIFTRRANKDITVCLGDSLVKRIAERIFLSKVNYELVYLVENKCSVPCRVIPNHFELDKFGLVIPPKDGMANVFWVGTWDERKGADRLVYAVECYDGHLPTINVYGGLGKNAQLNNLLQRSAFFDFHGVVPCPYEKFFVGDVFITLSYLEGFQRAMVEAMLKGCLVLAVERPDTLVLKGSEGVIVVNWEENDRYSSALEIAKKINELSKLSWTERIRLGQINREFAASIVSEKPVLRKWRELIEYSL